MKVSVVVPCYNEESNIDNLVGRFAYFAKEYNIELILVDNGSKDRTRELIVLATKKYSFVRLVIVEENIGYGNGILQGLKNATGDLLGWIHADLQSDPAVFKKMIESAKTETGPFLYKGARKNRSFADSFFTFGMSLLESVYFKLSLWDINSQPTLLSRQFFCSWKNPPFDFSLDLYVYVMAKVQKLKIQKFLSIQHKRTGGISSWNQKWYSRVKMITRVLQYSKKLKKQIKESETSL